MTPGLGLGRAVDSMMEFPYRYSGSLLLTPQRRRARRRPSDFVWINLLLLSAAPHHSLVFALIFQSVQVLCVILYKVVGAFTKILPYINNARADSSTAASVDVVGRLSQSGWIRNLWLRWFARRQHAHSE